MGGGALWCVVVLASYAPGALVNWLLSFNTERDGSER